jgi:predicted AlkP superfamily pyrophosphatase or phosphodiesterase
MKNPIRLAIVTAVLAGGGVAFEPSTPPVLAAQATSARPALVVVLTVDQFRADYIDQYSERWTGGLRRLLREGAVFTRAAYPYGGTVTCPGHATIGTGALPVTHGIVGNAWYDRATRRLVACAADPTVESVPFGGATGRERHSPASLKIPTLADELQRQGANAPRVVSVALKPRSAIMVGGRGDPDTVVVWEEDDGTWATSTAYASAPWPDVDAYIRSHPIAAAYGQSWTLLRRPDTYRHTDDAAGEGTPTNWTRTFPHLLDSPNGKPDGVFVSRWERSPWSDEYVADLAMHLLETRELGRRAATDFLALSLPALDIVGHEYGPRSFEVQDVLARADRTIGRLLDRLDQVVGAGRYVLAFSSDHGVAGIPEQMRRRGRPAGRVPSGAVSAAVEESVRKILGPGTYFARNENLNVSLEPGTVDRLRQIPGAIDAVRDALGAIPGIDRAYGPDELAGTGPADAFLRAWRLSYVPGRTGDFVLVPDWNWLVRSTAGTTHGTPHDYDQRVPLVLFGAGVKRGRYASAATPADIAPTLAALVDISLPHATGRALREALARQ